MVNSAGLRKFLAHLLPVRLRKFVPPSVSKHLYFHGKFPVYFRRKKFFELQANGYILENDVFFYGLEGGHEKKAMQVWIEFCEKFKPREVFDIGANTGIYGLVTLALDSSSHVSFFEPLPKALEILRENLSLNQFDAKVFDVALSNYDGEGHFFMSTRSDFAYSVTLNTYADLAIGGAHNENEEYTKIFSRVRQVSTLLKSEEVGKPNLVKMDVETHESEVLEGFHFDLYEVDAYLVEVLNADAADKLNGLFGGMGFDFYNVNDVKGSVQKTDRIYFTGHYNYFVIKPELARQLSSLQ
jgi:FkbM family methyltransferase